MKPLYLQSTHNPVDAFHSGSLSAGSPGGGGPDHYVHDPRDVSLAALEATVDPESRTDQRMLHAAIGKLLIHHSALFDEDTDKPNSRLQKYRLTDKGCEILKQLTLTQGIRVALS